MSNMASKARPHRGGQWAVTLAGAPVTGLFGIFAGKVLDRLGWLDPPAAALAKFLQTNVQSGALGDWLGFLIFAILYALVLRFAWIAMPKQQPGGYRVTIGPRPSKELRVHDPIETPLGNHPRPSTSRSARSAREVRLAEALGWAAYGEWGKPILGGPFSLAMGGLPDMNELLGRFTALAAEGRLTIWGKEFDTGLFKKIPVGYWHGHELRTPDILGGAATNGPDGYTDLMLNKAEVQTEWPHE